MRSNSNSKSLSRFPRLCCRSFHADCDFFIQSLEQQFPIRLEESSLSLFSWEPAKRVEHVVVVGFHVVDGGSGNVVAFAVFVAAAVVSRRVLADLLNELCPEMIACFCC